MSVLSPESKIYVAGHTGMVGSALCRQLQAERYHNLVLRTHAELDLRNQQAVLDFFEVERPELVFLAAAKVGGILANNTYRAEFLYDNLMIAANVIQAAYQCGVKKLLFLGSSCIYPKHAPQPMPEETLLSGPLEPTNEPYAIAKIAGLKLCQTYREQYGCDFIAAMPTNLYGPNDTYDLAQSHVVPALIRKLHEAKAAGDSEVEIWGTGTPRRELMHVDDLARACMFLMNHYSDPLPINVGTGEEVTIADLAEAVQSVVGYSGKLVFNPQMPDGTPRKLLDTSRLQALGFRHQVDLRSGLVQTYQDFLHHYQVKYRLQTM